MIPASKRPEEAAVPPDKISLDLHHSCAALRAIRELNFLAKKRLNVSITCKTFRPSDTRCSEDQAGEMDCWLAVAGVHQEKVAKDW